MQHTFKNLSDMKELLRRDSEQLAFWDLNCGMSFVSAN